MEKKYLSPDEEVFLSPANYQMESEQLYSTKSNMSQISRSTLSVLASWRGRERVGASVEVASESLWMEMSYLELD
jgi:hypothetical protein